MLHTEAQKLCLALEAIVIGLETYDKDDRQNYTKVLAAALKPHITNFRVAIDQLKSREIAKDILGDIAELMHEINGAATKGDIDFISGDVLNTYWQLKAIFQETKFRDEQL